MIDGDVIRGGGGRRGVVGVLVEEEVAVRDGEEGRKTRDGGEEERCEEWRERVDLHQ